MFISCFGVFKRKSFTKYGALFTPKWIFQNSGRINDVQSLNSLIIHHEIGKSLFGFTGNLKILD